jgi:hypothetical protein
MLSIILESFKFLSLTIQEKTQGQNVILKTYNIYISIEKYKIDYWRLTMMEIILKYAY